MLTLLKLTVRGWNTGVASDETFLLGFGLPVGASCKFRGEDSQQFQRPAVDRLGGVNLRKPRQKLGPWD